MSATGPGAASTQGLTVVNGAVARLIEGLNQKGLYTYSGQPKHAAVTVAKLYKALPPG